jgi:hypothetical protein
MEHYQGVRNALRTLRDVQEFLRVIKPLPAAYNTLPADVAYAIANLSEPAQMNAGSASEVQK